MSAKRKNQDELREEGYIAGRRAAALEQLWSALRELNWKADPERARIQLARSVRQLEQAREALRRAYQEQNIDWPGDGCVLADLITGFAKEMEDR